MFTYCHNNPILYADPYGRFIVIFGDATDEQIVEYNRAVAYIKKSPTGSALIDFLEASTETFTIVFVDNDMTQYNYDTNQIDWDVNSGLIMGNNTSVQSAALGLAHEMGHAAQDINGIYEQHKTNGNFLEQDNLDTYESKIASELGEPSRSGRGAYYGAKGFMDMNNSTHFRTTQHSPWYHYVLPFIFGWPQKTIVDHNMLD